MLELALMIEGQDGLNWSRWQRLARAAEDLGFAGLYRSDHYTNPYPPERDSLELWMSLAWLASNTSRIEFGPLVSPVSFREPTMTARMAAAVDDLSGGRLQLGLGAGWNEREHAMFGFDLLDTQQRFARFSEGLEVVSRLLRSDVPVSFAGKFYLLNDAILLPRPQRRNGPPIVIGGNGPKLTLPRVVHYADEWNAVMLPVERFKELNAQLDELLRQAGRELSSVRRTLMVQLIFGHQPEALREKLEQSGQQPDEMRARGTMFGSSEEVTAQLRQWADAGVQRIMLQWLDQDDIAGLEAFAQQVMPNFRSG